MTKYVALLRGIGPGNPNMHGEKLAGTVTSLGFSNARPFISSGNVIFESNSEDIAKMEAMMEKAWPEKLGFNSSTIIRSQQQLQALLAAQPYKNTTHSRQTYLLVTFFKQSPKAKPDDTDGQFYSVAGVNALCSTLDTTAAITPDFMNRLKRQHGEGITSRTWNTLNRILQKME